MRGGPPPSGAVVDEFDQLVATGPGGIERWWSVRAAFREYVPDDSAGREFARRVQRHVSRGEPASFIRLGDGEGNLLALRLGTYPALSAYCARKASVRHFGAPEVLPRTAGELLEPFHVAIRNADAVGFPRGTALEVLLRNRRSRIDVRGAYGIASVFAYLERFRDDLDLASKTGVSKMFHRDLLPYYQSLIDGRDIGLVSCHAELVDALRHRVGARSVTFYPVPKQATIGGQPGMDTGHVPGRCRELVEELRDCRPGMLYLVAAGIPAEIYCDVIRAAGGIALDIGSVADIWAGRRSRKITSQETVDRWRMT
jgi:hypothetical protein